MKLDIAFGKKFYGLGAMSKRGHHYWCGLNFHNKFFSIGKDVSEWDCVDYKRIWLGPLQVNWD